ncbi:sphingosine kinase [Tieghemostelium lacteum]|uniref:Sphingosine kinase n=1 Tax=Tieghemostelium lacteum TaxID=361077 RepID=A0A151ZA25_TIELA|nr:sphingosine kinase [Tieghemostelium lacteum]|eukprot:KYQ90810.1 sphingosine kinase [Tieghemostelium lacteum]
MSNNNFEQQQQQKSPSLVSKKKLDNESFVAALNSEEILYEDIEIIYKKKSWKIIVKKSCVIVQQNDDKKFTQYLISDTIVGVALEKDSQQKVAMSCCIIKTPEPETRKRKSFQFQFINAEQAQSFINAVQTHILNNLPGKNPKNRRIRVILNPKSGKKLSEQIFKDVSALFDDAGIFVKKTTTRGPEHAKKIGFTFDYKKYDTIVFISGDGLFHEFINGLMARDDWKDAVKINLALIPGGTGNGLACSIGLSDPMSAALAVVRGYSRPLDVSIISQGESKWCSILSLTWGIISDVDIESEKYRYLGPLRLQIGAAIRILMLRVYKGRLLYQPVVESTKQTLSKIPKCSYECEICISNRPDQLIHSYVNSIEFGKDKQNGDDNQDIHVNININIDSSPIIDNTESIGSSSNNTSTNTITNESPSSSSSSQTKPKEKKKGFDKIDIPNLKVPTRDLLSENEQNLLENGWKLYDGEFIGLVASTVSHLAPDFISSPTAHLNDGNIDLVIIKHNEQFKKTDLLSILTDSAEGKHLENHAIDHHKVKSLILEPGPEKEGIIAIDGERISYGRTSMECIRGGINLICRSY